MNWNRFSHLVKEANAASGLNLLSKSPSTFKLPEIKQPEMPKINDIAKPIGLPKVDSIDPVKLDTGIGKSKPAFTHELKTNSPYNEK